MEHGRGGGTIHVHARGRGREEELKLLWLRYDVQLFVELFQRWKARQRYPHVSFAVASGGSS
jgi:hypothetical protein